MNTRLTKLDDKVGRPPHAASDLVLGPVPPPAASHDTSQPLHINLLLAARSVTVESATASLDPLALDTSPATEHATIVALSRLGVFA